MTTAARTWGSEHVESMISASRRDAGVMASGQSINLAVGEPDLAPPTEVVESLKQALDAGHTHYVDLAGDEELRTAIAALESANWGREVRPAAVQVTAGATAGIAATILGTTSVGDRVVMPDPTYSLYADVVRLAGGIPVPVACLPSLHLDLEALAPALKGARSFVYCSPVNPTGVVYHREELEGVARLLDPGTIVIDDGAYSSLVYQPHRYVPAAVIPGLADRTVYCQTFSKKFAMTGFRVGYLVAPEELLPPIAAVHRTFNGSVNAAVQKSAVTALAMGPSFADFALRTYRRRLDLVQELMKSIPVLEAVPPEGAFYLFPKILTGHSSSDTARHLARHGVRVRSGAEFGAGGEGHLRISYAASEESLEAGFGRIKAAMNLLG
ncbi:aspartate aminotransferase [Amycolatopsis sulphurea]|uniref:Aspartate aminotransferase n=1 Tax=Amycolatopsis sulphurea TaxID=76022 RepID=A0A2A9FH13_9PSEU|nr:aminotransferase class I/II-fold pyridoxal phosphate-dependent enzyme [Amycolatopsis sulphurea]PFG50654.1 aspartate aminotransferase [Amycolatopsis sulphurea]